MTTAGPPVVLALRALGLGDLLTAVPALNALARAFVGHRLVVAAPRPLEPLVTLLPFELIDVRAPDPFPFNGPVDVAVNLHGSGPRSSRALVALRPAKLITFRHPDVAET